MKKFLLTLVAVLIPSVGYAGGIGVKNITEELKGYHVCLDRIATRTTSTAAGVDGIIFQHSLVSIGKFSATSSIATLPYPAKLEYDLADAGAGQTLTCSSLTIVGWDQFGNKIRYTDSTVTETNERTTQVFGAVESIAVTGCASGTDVGDRFWVGASAQIGLQRKVNHASDIESYCISDASNSDLLTCAANNDGTSSDIQSAVDLTNHSVDVSTAMFKGSSGKVAAAADDGVCWVIRPSFF